MNDFREYSDYLMHYGRKGMKWGENRFEAIEPSKGRKPSKGGDDTSDNGNNSGGFLNRLQNNFSDLASRVEQHGNEAMDVGNKMTQEITVGNYGTAFDIYKNASPEARNIINAYVKDSYIVPALMRLNGAGDEKRGQEIWEKGERIANTLFNNKRVNYIKDSIFNKASNLTRQALGTNFRRNEDLDIHRIPGKRING